MKTYGMMTEPMMQEETLAAIAHDLRTPMCSVSGAAQMALLASGQGRGVEEQLYQILAAVEAMDVLLQGWCEGKSGRRRDAAEIAAQLRAIMQPGAQRKGQKLDISLDGIDAAAWPAETAEIERILMNLTSNAIKYTPEGGCVSVKASTDGNEIVFCVADNGMGMKRSFLRKMYKPFERAKESAEIPGTGIGLSVVRRMVRKLDGTIRVISTWGKGTEFTVRIPVRASELQ